MSRETLEGNEEKKKQLTLPRDCDRIIKHKEKEAVMNGATMKAVRESAAQTLAKGADIAFKTTVVVLTLRLLGIL